MRRRYPSSVTMVTRAVSALCPAVMTRSSNQRTSHEAGTMLEVSNGIGMTLCLPQHEHPKNRPRTSTTVTIDLGHDTWVPTVLKNNRGVPSPWVGARWSLGQSPASPWVGRPCGVPACLEW